MSQKVTAPPARTNETPVSRSGGALQPRPATSDRTSSDTEDDERIPGQQPDTQEGPVQDMQFGSDFSRIPAYAPSAETPPRPTATARTQPTTPGQRAKPEVEERTAAGFLVADSLSEAGPGQARKSDFLDELRSAVLQTSERALAESALTTEGCPWIDHWFGYYSTKEPGHIEKALHKFAPKAIEATSANEYIPIVAERVNEAIATWLVTGEISGLPENVPLRLAGEQRDGHFNLVPEGVGPGDLDRLSGLTTDTQGAAAPQQEIQTQLGTGKPLDHSIRAPMESAYGMDFSEVRVHADDTAAQLSSQHDARAFAIGEHIAFGKDEYRPGTLVGDALIAHELAHVAQQKHANTDVVQQEQHADTALETDADRSAFSAISSMWLGAKQSLAGITETAKPRLQSGLGMRRCKSKFPSYSQIVGDSDVQTATDAAWASTEAAATAAGRREEGFWIRLNTATTKYEFTQHFTGPVVGPAVGASATPGAKPADTPNPSGATYTVGLFHTHTPTAHRPVGRGVGPSGADDSFHNSNDVVGVVYDYVESPAGSGNIPAGHPIGSAAQRYHSGPNRRQNE